MAKIKWHDFSDGQHKYRQGVDHAVVYLEDKAFPWNGITKIAISKSGYDQSLYHFFGERYRADIESSGLGVNIQAYIYPDELSEYIGIQKSVVDGIYIDEYDPKYFNMSFRTYANEDVSLIHILFNVLLTPTSEDYSTISDVLSPMIFNWNGDIIPERVLDGWMGHIIIDCSKIDPGALERFEEYLYGTDKTDPNFGMITWMAHAIYADDCDVIILPSADDSSFTFLFLDGGYGCYVEGERYAGRSTPANGVEYRFFPTLGEVPANLTEKQTLKVWDLTDCDGPYGPKSGRGNFRLEVKDEAVEFDTITGYESDGNPIYGKTIINQQIFNLIMEDFG